MIKYLFIIVSFIFFQGKTYAEDHYYGFSYFEHNNGDLYTEPATMVERILIESIIEACPRKLHKNFDYNLALSLLRQDKKLINYPSLYGISLAIWCIESSFMKRDRRGNKIMGDYRPNRGFLSHGPLQLMRPRFESCNGNDKMVHDILWAARCWIKENKRVFNKYKDRYKYCSEYDLLFLSEAFTSNYRLYKPKCNKDDNNYKMCMRKVCKKRSLHGLVLEKSIKIFDKKLNKIMESKIGLDKVPKGDYK